MANSKHDPLADAKAVAGAIDNLSGYFTDKPPIAEAIPDETVLEMQGRVVHFIGVCVNEDIHEQTENGEYLALMSARAERVYSELERLQAKLDAIQERAQALMNRLETDGLSNFSVGFIMTEFVDDLASGTFPKAEKDGDE